jgi:hypothetical protein
MKKLIIFALLVVLFGISSVQAQIAIEAIKFGTGIEKSEVTGEATSFPAETEKVYCWFRITGAQGKTVMTKWYRNDVFLSEVALEITSNNMRTNAFKSIFGNGGNYKVEVIDDGGKVIQTAEFVITGGSEAAATTATGGSDGDLRIEALKFGTGVEKSEVTGEANAFSASTEKVYCWLKVLGGNEKSVTVKWYYNNLFMSDVALEIKSTSMRTYAVKTIAGNKGEWRVEVVGPSGAVLQAAAFTIN